MDQSQVSLQHSSMGAMTASMMNDPMSEPSSPESIPFDNTDLLSSAVQDEVTAQLAASGPIGVAAAAAIATGKKRRRPHLFETNPSIRRRQQTRLLRKLKATIEEYTTRVGQQAVVLCCTPGKPSTSSNGYKVFGSQPLENVIRGCRGVVMQDLDAALAQQAPPAQPDCGSLHELPPLVIDGIPTPVDKMTQAQLRAFIPEMLKYSTGRSKPGWGKLECRPLWWPDDVPWANVRSDVRSMEQKRKVSWTHALRTIVKNCYKHHGRDDLMPNFHDSGTLTAAHIGQNQMPHQTMVQTINNPDGTVSIIQIDTGDMGQPQIVTLADGTQAQVVQTLSNGLQQHEANQAVQTLADVASNQAEITGVIGPGMDMTGAQTVTMNQDGQIILAGEGNELPKELTFDQTGQIVGMVTIPVSMYQTVFNNVGQHGVIEVNQDPNDNPLTIADMTGTPEKKHNILNGHVPDAVEIITVEPNHVVPS